MEPLEEITLGRDSLDVMDRGDWIRAETQGQAVRFAAARAAFLDCLLRDEEVVGQVVDRFDEITGASNIVARIHQHFDEGQGNSSASASHRPDGHKHHEIGMQLTKELFGVVLGEDDSQTRALISAAAKWGQTIGFDWPWLVHDLVRWYREKVMHLSPKGGWFGHMQRAPDEWHFTPLEEPEWPQVILRHRKGETLHAYRQRARDAFSNLLRELEDEWPRGRLPTDITTIERDVQWFYRHNAKGESKSAIAASAFASLYEHATPTERDRLIDGRRKDVREGIRRAGDLLNSSGLRFS